MPLSAGYVARETTTNLRRNALMSVAAIVTMAVGLLFAGSALLWQRGIDRQAGKWKGGVELSIFMQPAASDQQVQAVNDALNKDVEVKRATFVDKPAAFKEMKDLFKESPDVLDTLSEQDAPPSFRVVPKKAEQVDDIGARYKDTPGVLKVTYAKETIDVLLKSTKDKRFFAAVMASIALLSAVLVILNTVRMAIFSRRREVAIMKLVGATNWFIRIPFMLEGMAQGLLGAAGAFVVIYLLRRPIMGFVDDAALGGLAKLYATGGEAITTGVVLLLLGALMGAASSALAVRRFLDV